ncbi:MAG: 16S rRNA (guanine(527)-N(7))-methyltransferase RsmG [Clostridia bacterium]|nr:16S rRNA (guanine(527)-N(7))-methyltransferase RsmG [Clostridia bacterium]
METVKTFEEIFTENAKKIGLAVQDSAIARFKAYYNLLMEWNEKMNLTAITDLEGVIVKHFIDSLTVLKDLPAESKCKLVDVGTGAGFPGVPIKIIKEDAQVTLIDSLNKRLTFLQDLSKRLNLKITLVHARAEEAGHKETFREKFDVSVARAVAALDVLAEYCLPLVKVGGVFLAMKGGDCEEEVNKAKRAVDLLGGKIEKIEKFKIPNDSSRSIITIRKVKKINDEYPRSSKKIVRSPL